MKNLITTMLLLVGVNALAQSYTGEHNHLFWMDATNTLKINNVQPSNFPSADYYGDYQVVDALMQDDISDRHGNSMARTPNVSCVGYQAARSQGEWLSIIALSATNNVLTAHPAAKFVFNVDDLRGYSIFWHKDDFSAVGFIEIENDSSFIFEPPSRGTYLLYCNATSHILDSNGRTIRFEQERDVPIATVIKP